MTSDRAMVRRILLTGLIGSAIEWYDFYLYSTAIALVIGPLFFPASSPTTQTLAAFTTYAAGFVARPLGGLLAGHFGDRIGRKSMLVVTLAVMGAATFGVGVLPTYRQIGVLAPVLLVILRVLQGIGIGGEWGGGLLLAIENAPPGRRGRYSGWPMIGFPLGLMASTLTFVLLSHLPKAEFLAWGWRVPFLASVVLVGIGIYVRVGIAETRDFAAVRRDEGVVRMPILAVLRHRPRQVCTGALAALGVGSVVSMFTVYLPSTVTDPARHGTVLTALMIGAGLQSLTVLLATRLPDRYGRKPLLVFGYLVAALGAVIVVAMNVLGTGNLLLVVAVYLLAMPIGHAAAYGNLGIFLADLFPTRIRFSALATTYQLGATISSFLPLVATAISGGARASWSASWLFVAVVCVASVAVLLAPAAEPEVRVVHNEPDLARQLSE